MRVSERTDLPRAVGSILCGANFTPKGCMLPALGHLLNSTVIGARMSHRKWRETKQQLT